MGLWRSDHKLLRPDRRTIRARSPECSTLQRIRSGSGARRSPLRRYHAKFGELTGSAADLMWDSSALAALIFSSLLPAAGVIDNELPGTVCLATHHLGAPTRHRHRLAVGVRPRPRSSKGDHGNRSVRSILSPEQRMSQADQGKSSPRAGRCRTSVPVQSTPRAIRCQQPLLRVPIQRQHGAPGQSLHGEVWWLAAVRDRVDDRRGKKREPEEASDIARADPFPRRDRGD